MTKLITVLLFCFWLAAALNGDVRAVVALTLAIVLIEVSG